MKAKAVLTLLRPSQWVKNLIVFGALIFAREFTDFEKVKTSLLAFAIFCLLSSTIYIINDIIDRESDRSHPLKKNRPLAAGVVQPATAWILALITGAIAVGLTITMPELFELTVLIFLAFNILYSLVLKRIVIIDVMAI